MKKKKLYKNSVVSIILFFVINAVAVMLSFIHL